MGARALIQFFVSQWRADVWVVLIEQFLLDHCCAISSSVPDCLWRRGALLGMGASQPHETCCSSPWGLQRSRAMSSSHPSWWPGKDRTFLIWCSQVSCPHLHPISQLLTSRVSRNQFPFVSAFPQQQVQKQASWFLGVSPGTFAFFHPAQPQAPALSMPAGVTAAVQQVEWKSGSVEPFVGQLQSLCSFLP